MYNLYNFNNEIILKSILELKMNKNKLSAASLALALSLGSITPGLRDSFIHTAYASETGSTAGSENAHSNPQNTSQPSDQSQNLTKDQKKANLQVLVDEKQAVVESPRYLNASTSEKTSYETAVYLAATAIIDDKFENYETLKTNVEEAKASLGAKLMQSADNRDALRYNIATAEKMRNDHNINFQNQIKLEAAIDNAKSALKDVELSDKQIVDANVELCKVIYEVADIDSIQVSKYTLTSQDLNDLKSEENLTYNKLRKDLYNLIQEANALANTQSYNNLENNDDTKCLFVNELTSAVNVYNSTNSTKENLETVFDNLNNSYNTIATAIDAKDTQISRAIASLTALVGDAHDTFVKTNEYKASNKFSRANYDQAVSRAKSLLEDETATVSQVQNAHRNVSIAKLSVLPVPTKTLNGDNSNTNTNKQPAAKPANLDGLKNLINEAKSIREGNEYINAKKDARDMYDNAINLASLIRDNTNPSADEIKIATDTINNAKAALKNSVENTENDAQLIASLSLLRSLIDNASSTKDSIYYKQASDARKLAYDQALNEGIILQIENASGKRKPSIKEVNEAISKINTALEAIGYTDRVSYPTSLIDLIDESASFRQTNNFKRRSASEDPFDKSLIKTYNELIQTATNYNKESNKNEAVVKSYVDRINDVKRAINSEISVAELNLRGFVANDGSYKLSKKYYDASNSSNETIKEATSRYNSLIAEAKQVLNSANKTDEKMTALAKSLQDLINLIENPTEENINRYKLQGLIESATRVKAHSKFNDIPQQHRDSLEKALSKAKEIVGKSYSSLVDIKSAISDLEAALNARSIKDLIDAKSNSIKNHLNDKLNSLNLKELIDLANKVKNHPDYKDASAAETYTLENSLKDAQNAIDMHESGISLVTTTSGSSIIAYTPEKAESIRNIAKDDLIIALTQETIKPIVIKILSGSTTNSKDISILDLDKLIEIADKVIAHADYKDVGATQGKNLKDALDAAKAAKTDEEKKEAQTALLSALNQSEIRPIVTKVRASGNVSVEAKDLTDLKQLIEFTKKVMDHGDYSKVDEKLRSELGQAFINAKTAADGNDETKIKASKDELNRLLSDERLKSIVDEIRASATISPKSIIEKIVSEDEAFRKTDKFKRAQKSLQDIYIKALNEANTLAKNENAKEADLKTASDALVAAKNALDGDQFTARVKALKEKYAGEKDSISDAAKKADIEKLIAALDGDDATMDNLLAAEAALKSAPKLTGSATPVTTTTSITTTPVPTTTTTPVTTTSTVPATINPGSIVRTGIKSLIGVAALLALAVGAFVITGKKKDNNSKTKKVYENDSNKKGE